MQHSTQIPEIPKLENFHHFAWHCALQEDGHELLTLAKIEGGFPALPELFFPPTYALEFIVKGTIHGTINQNPVELQPNSCVLFWRTLFWGKLRLAKTVKSTSWVLLRNSLRS